MEILYRVLEIINYVAIAIASLGFLVQVIMILFFWLPEKRFPVAEAKAKIAVVICAWNEEDVIGGTVTSILGTQEYPRDRYQIYVIADNCDDQTAEKARAAGAIVFENKNPEHHNHGWAIHDGIQLVLEHASDSDFVVFIDADNRLHPDFLSRMNDAFHFGVRIARPFEASTNGGQNTWSAVSACYYLRDSRIASNFRERIHSDSMLCTPGMMVATQILKEHGFDAVSNSEDVEFTIKSLRRGYKVHYVADAIVCEDQPSTSKDTWNRLTRMGNGIHKLFWKQGWGFLLDFFRHPRYSRIDLFLQMMIIPVDIICFLWFPAYYIFYVLLHMFNAWGPNAGYLGFFTPDGSIQTLYTLGIMVLIVVSVYFIIYIFQTGMAAICSKKKLGLKSLKGYKRGIWLSSLFMVYYAFAIIVGVFSNAGWKKINRNKGE